MLNINPLLLVGGVIGAVTALLIFAYASVKDKKTAMGFERTMADGEILRRLFAYAKPYWAKFLLVLFLMLFSIAYDIISPLIVGAIEELVAADFALSRLFASVAVYAGVLVFSMASTYFQAVILQRVGQRIISDLREDLFTHIESLSHEQLNEIPVGKLVTRVTNDTNAISMMFTNLLVNLIKNAFVILGILVAMLCLNYALTLMVLCFVPFIVIFTVIFRKFSAGPTVRSRMPPLTSTPIFRRTFPVSRSPRFLAARTKRWRSSTKKPDPFQGHAGTDFCVRRIPPAGLHAVHQLYFVPVLPGRHGPPEQRFFPGADHHRRHHRHLLHVHFQVLYPHPEPGRAVQLAAIRAGLVGKSLFYYGHSAQAGGCPRRH